MRFSSELLAAAADRAEQLEASSSAASISTLLSRRFTEAAEYADAIDVPPADAMEPSSGVIRVAHSDPIISTSTCAPAQSPAAEPPAMAPATAPERAPAPVEPSTSADGTSGGSGRGVRAVPCDAEEQAAAIRVQSLVRGQAARRGLTASTVVAGLWRKQLGDEAVNQLYLTMLKERTLPTFYV